MIRSDEADPPHAKQIIIKKEMESLTLWLRHIIFIPKGALITSCFSYYLLSVLKLKWVWQPLEIPISSITAHLRMTEGCEKGEHVWKKRKSKTTLRTWGVT